MLYSPILIVKDVASTEYVGVLGVGSNCSAGPGPPKNGLWPPDLEDTIFDIAVMYYIYIYEVYLI